MCFSNKLNPTPLQTVHIIIYDHLTYETIRTVQLICIGEALRQSPYILVWTSRLWRTLQKYLQTHSPITFPKNYSLVQVVHLVTCIAWLYVRWDFRYAIILSMCFVLLQHNFVEDHNELIQELFCDAKCNHWNYKQAKYVINAAMWV